MDGLRQRGPVTWPFALPRPAPSRRPRAVLHGSEVARAAPGRRRAHRQVDGSSVRAHAHLLLVAAHASFSHGWSSPFGIQRVHPSRSSTVLTRVLRSRPLRRPSVCPACRLLRACLAMRCPGSGPSVRSSGSRCGPSRRNAADLRSPARADRRWRACRRLQSLLAANQWIAETSAVVEPIVRGRSPHSLPMVCPLVPGAWRGPFRRRARKRGVPANGGGPESGSCPHAGRPARADSAASGGGLRWNTIPPARSPGWSN